MRWTVRLQGGSDGTTPSELAVEGENWFSALQTALVVGGLALGSGEVRFALLDDGLSAQVEDIGTGLKADVFVEGNASQPPADEVTEEDEEVTPSGPRARAPAAQEEPPPGPQTFTPEGKYAPGETHAFLAGAFMKLSDLYGSFGGQADEAVRFVLDFADRAFEAEGGGVALADINDPGGRLVFRAAYGPSGAALVDRELVMGEGPVGLCAASGAPVILEDIARDRRFASGLLHDLGIREGPIMCVPLSREEWVQGVVAVWGAPGAHPFTAGQQEILAHLATTLGDYLTACRALEAEEG